MRSEKLLSIFVLLVGLVIGGLFWQPTACGETISFSRISSNAPEDAAQFWTTLTSPDASHVRFEFHNSSSVYCSITDIYLDFDDGHESDLWDLFDGLPSVVNCGTLFDIGAHPGNLPGGHGLEPIFYADFSCQSQNQPPTLITNGVDVSSDYVALVFALDASVSFNDIVNAVRDGSLRIGFHVQAIDGDPSDCFISNSAPEPSTILLLGTGVLALAGFTRRRFMA